MKLFDINFSVPRHTVDSRVISDGVDPRSLAIVTRERMRELTGLKNDDFYVLFQALVDKVEKPTQETHVEQKEPSETVTGAKAPVGRRGRPRKEA